MYEMVKALENPKVASTIGAGAMSTPLLSSLGDVATIACAFLGGLLSVVAIIIQLRKNSRGKKKYEREMELLEKKIAHEDLEISIDTNFLKKRI